MAKAKNSGLGRGLDSLLGNYDATTQAAPAKEEPKKEEKADATRTVVALDPEEAEDIATEKVLNKQSDDRATNRVLVVDDEISVKTVGEAQTQAIRQETKEHAPAKKVAPEDPREVTTLPLTAIKPNPNQPRTNFKKEELEELASSIQRDGLLQPILVRPMGKGEYQIIAGERRWQACRLLKLEEVPVRVKEAEDAEVLKLAIIENVQRSDLNPIEEAYGYKRLMEAYNLTQAQVAQEVSKGRSTITNALRLLELPEEAQQLLFEEKITAGHARAILSVPTAEGKKKLTEKLQKDKLSVRETENIARLMSMSPSDKKPSDKTPAPKSFKIVQRQLRNLFQAPVKVKSVQGKNKIEIEFKDEEELERLLNIMTNKEA